MIRNSTPVGLWVLVTLPVVTATGFALLLRTVDTCLSGPVGSPELFDDPVEGLDRGGVRHPQPVGPGAVR